ncbi:hypothetical protein N8654_01290 [Synechococcus sp. AH-601-B19]|nr:hypothetical protein [Synechococcus sp. AH-601-B19]
MDLPLFGIDFHPKFRKTCITPNFKEYKNYEKAIKQGSIFQARHLIKLEGEASPPDSLLLHIDLTGVIKGLGHAAASISNKERIERKTNIPTPSSNMIIPEICDLMVSSYVSNPFFKRFNNILVNTICTNFRNNALQLNARKSSEFKAEKASAGWKNLGFKSAESAKKFHKEAYNSWERNLYLLHPEKILFTTISASGHLTINNEVTCTDWRSKAKIHSI